MGFKKIFGKVLKVAAPIAASFIPGVGPAASALIGGGMGAAGGALSGDSFGRSLMDAALGAAPGAIKGLKGLKGGVPSTGARTDSSFWDTLQGQIPNLLQAGGTVMAGAGTASAANRDAKLAAMMDQNAQNITAQSAFNNANIARSAEDRAGQGDAWQKLISSSYAKNYVPPSADTNDPYRRAMPGVSDDVKAGAEALMGQTRDDLMSGRFRTNGGAPLPMPTNLSAQVDPSLVNPSMWEKIFNTGEPALDVLGAALKKKPVVPAAKTA